MLFHICPAFGKEDGRVINFVEVEVRKMRWSGSGFVRNWVNIYDDGSSYRETILGCCRREVCSDTVVELARVSVLDSVLADNRDSFDNLHRYGEPSIAFINQI